MRQFLISFVFLLLVLLSVHGWAEGYPESEHPYAKNSDITWTYTHAEEAYALKVTFSEDTELESNYDYLYITAEDGTQQKFTGTSLQGESVYLLGSSFTLRLTSNSFINKNGFTVTAVEAVTQEEYETYLTTPKYKINASGLITAFSGQVAELVIPSSIDDITVTGIGSAAFQNNTVLTSVEIPDGVTSIGSYAFYGCSNLAQVTVPESVTTIGDWVFRKIDALKRIELPDGLESIGVNAFSINTVLVFGSSETIRQYAIDNFLQYVSDTESVLRDETDTLEAKIGWIVDTYIDAGMSEYEKALTLHNWLVANVAYDYDFSNNVAPPVSEYGVSGKAAILDGYAICHGYAQAYEWLLEEAGMEVKHVNSSDHTWNIVKIDGDWYHVDVTWDDSIGELFDYDFFGLSDMAIHAEPKHHATQHTYCHLVCDSWEANYYYRNGYLDAALARLRSAINESIAAGTYSGNVTLSYSEAPSGEYSHYTLALILDNDSDWSVAGRAEITPNSSTSYDFVFYPDEELVTDIIVEGIDASIEAYPYYTMYPGYAAQMNVSTLPQGKPVSFASSDEQVVTVSEDGLITAVAGGSAMVTLTSGNRSRAYNISVVSGSKLLDGHSIYLDKGETFQLKLRCNMFLKDSAAVMASADETVASVSSDGLITAVGYGKTTVTYTTAAGVTDTLTVYVRKLVTDVIFTQEVYESYAGLTILPEVYVAGCDQNAYNKTFGRLAYTVSDDTIAGCSYLNSSVWVEDGAYWIYRPSVKCLTPGEVTLTATAIDGSGVSGSCTIVVTEGPKLTSIVLDAKTYEGYAGEIILPSFFAYGEDVDYYKENYGSLTYTFSDDTIARFYGYGSPSWNAEAGCWVYQPIIELLAPGVVTMTATAKDGSGVSASYTITVKEGSSLTAVAFESDSYTAMEGEIIDLVLRTQADDPDYYKEAYGSFTYVSSDKSIATRYATYAPVWNEELACWEYTVRVRCLAPGEVTFTATAKDGSGVSGSCTIVVTAGPKLTTIVPDAETYEGYEGEDVTISLFAYGEDIDYYKENYGSFTYVCSDESIARSYGYYSPSWNAKAGCWVYRPIIRLLAPGEVTFTATAEDGSGVSASCTITVMAAPELMALDYRPAVYEGRIGNYIYASLYAIADDPDIYRETYGRFTHQSSDTTVASAYGRYGETWSDADSCWVYHPAFLCKAPGIAAITSSALDTSGLTGTCQIIVHSDSTFELPAAIKTVESEAFLSIAAEEVILPEGIERIGSRAFADSATLKLINLPASLTSIAEDAFEGSEHVALICAENSEGQRFAENNGLPYVIR